MSIEKHIAAFLALWAIGILGTSIAQASQISVPSAPAANYFLISTTTGQYIATSTLQAKFLSGLVTNAQLANSSFVVTTASPLGGAGTIQLGGTLALTCTGCLTSLSGAASSSLLSDNNTFSGNTTFSTIINSLLATNGNGLLVSTSSPTAAFYIATSTTATSTFGGYIVVSGGTQSTSTFNGNLVIKGNLEDDRVTSALYLGDTLGVAQPFGGSSCGSNTFASSINGAGVLSCTNIPNAALANSTIVVNGTTLTLGDSADVLNGFSTTSAAWMIDSSSTIVKTNIVTLSALSLPYTQVTGVPSFILFSNLFNNQPSYNGQPTISTSTSLWLTLATPGKYGLVASSSFVTFASSSAETTTNFFSTTATTSSLGITGLASSLLAVTASGGVVSTSTIGDAQLTNTGVTTGAYTNANITVNAQGRIVVAANGSGGASLGYTAWGGSVSSTYVTSAVASTTAAWFQGQFFASSTPQAPSVIDNFTATNSTTTSATSTTFAILNAPSALLLTNSNGSVGKYGGSANCTNQLINGISALGVGNCVDGFSTTSSQYFLSVNQGPAFSTTSANWLINSSSTVAKTGAALTWPLTQTFSSVNFFNGGFVSNASTTIGNVTSTTTLPGNVMVGSACPGGIILGSTTPLQVCGNYGNFMQSLFWNTNTSNSASTDIVLNNNLSPASNNAYYAEFGINGGNYSQPAFAGRPNDMFFISSDGGMMFELASSTLNDASSSFAWTTKGTATSNIRMQLLNSGLLVMGTSTAAVAPLTIASSTAPQLALSDSLTANNAWTFRSIANSFYLATSTSFATSTTAAFSINPNGFGNFATGLSVGATSTPWAAFSLVSNSPYLFMLSTTSAATAASTTLFAINNYGGIQTSSIIAPTSTVITLDWSKTPPQVEYFVGTAAFTINIINATTTQYVGSRKLVHIHNPNSTAGALTWGGTDIRWDGDTTPTQKTTAGSIQTYSFDVLYSTTTNASFLSNYFIIEGTAGTGF